MSILPIFIPHAGCPHRCVFCDQKAISGQLCNSREAAKKQIDLWLPRLKKGQAHEAAFYGGSFTALPLDEQEKLLALTDELLAAGAIDKVRLSTRPDCIDEEVLALLTKHRVHLVELGAQSLDDKVLAAAERGHDSEAVYRAVSLLKEKNFSVGLQLMVGLPEEDGESVAATAKKAAALAPDVARIYPLVVLKNTSLAEKYLKGLYTPLTIEEATERGAVLYAALTAAGSKVIRIGLPPEATAEKSAVLAGPIHPCLGLLIKARVQRNELTPLLEEKYAEGERELTLTYLAGHLDEVQGYKKENLTYWQARFPQAELILKKARNER